MAATLALQGPLPQTDNGTIVERHPTLYKSLKYVAFGAVVVGTAAVASTTALGTFALLAVLLPATVGFGVYRAVTVIKSLNLDDTLTSSALKVEKVVRILLWSALIIGAVATGLGAASLIGGASLLISGIQLGGHAYIILMGLRNITWALGFAIPFGKWLLVNINSLDQKLSDFATRVAYALRSTDVLNETLGQRMSVLKTVLIQTFGGLVAQGNHNIAIEMLQFLGENAVRGYFRSNAPLFDDAKIRALTSKYPRWLDIGFQVSCLNGDQIQRIILPELQPKVDLDLLEKDVAQWKEQIDQLEKRYAADDKEGLYETVSHIVQKLSTATNAISAQKQLIEELQKTTIPTNTLMGKKADEASYSLVMGLGWRTDAMAELLVSAKEDSLRSRYMALCNKVAPKDQEHDLKEKASVTLEALGLRFGHFQDLAKLMGTDLEHLDEAFVNRGLGTKRDLITQGILSRPEGTSLTQELLMERLCDYLSGHPAVVQPAADAPTTADAPAPAPVVVTPSRFSLVARKVGRVANHAFTYISTGALVAVQVYQQPISTATGFVAGMAFLNLNNSIPFFLSPRIWSNSPNYVNASIAERCRGLWRQLFATTITLSSGVLGGGFFAGVQHAAVVRDYASPLLNRIRRAA